MCSRSVITTVSDSLNAPLIIFQRLLNEIANKTSFGNSKARPMQHHITGEYMLTPVGFGKGEMNIFTSGYSQKSMTNNDLVLSALNAVGFEFAPPTTWKPTESGVDLIILSIGLNVEESLNDFFNPR